VDDSEPHQLLTSLKLNISGKLYHYTPLSGLTHLLHLLTNFLVYVLLSQVHR